MNMHNTLLLLILSFSAASLVASDERTSQILAKALTPPSEQEIQQYLQRNPPETNHEYAAAHVRLSHLAIGRLEFYRIIGVDRSEKNPHYQALLQEIRKAEAALDAAVQKHKAGGGDLGGTTACPWR